MTRQDNRLWSPWQPDSSTVCLAFFHLKMKPEAKKSWKCNQQINWYKKKRKKKEQKGKLDYKQLKLQYESVSLLYTFTQTYTHQQDILKFYLINMQPSCFIFIFSKCLTCFWNLRITVFFFFLSSFKVTRQCSWWSILYCVCTGISKFLSSLVPISELPRDPGLMCNSFIWGLNEWGEQGQKRDQGWEIRRQFCLHTRGYHILLPLDLLSIHSCSSVELKESCSSFAIFSFLNREGSWNPIWHTILPM